MDLNRYVDDLRRELGVAAEAAGEEARSLAERLTGSLESATRLVLLEALSVAANEITRDLAPGSVDVRLRGRDPEFVVTAPPADELFEEMAESSTESKPDTVSSLGDESGTWRTTLRVPERLKPEIEAAASREGLSVNAWLTKAAVAALEPGEHGGRPGRSGQRGGQRYVGWVR